MNFGDSDLSSCRVNGVIVPRTEVTKKLHGIDCRVLYTTSQKCEDEVIKCSSDSSDYMRTKQLGDF